jgi:hypothetical protein
LEAAKEAGCIEDLVLTEGTNGAAMALCRSVGGIAAEPVTTMFTFDV